MRHHRPLSLRPSQALPSRQSRVTASGETSGAQADYTSALNNVVSR
ncbi:MAG TPA: hypothetical protein VJ810_17670 [Blastocatellia bacterium]|nr:hypothetical protein [Blastocatellia bacterium]